MADGDPTRLVRARTTALAVAGLLLVLAFVPGGDPPFTAHALRVLAVLFVAAPLLLLGLPPGPLAAFAARPPQARLLARLAAPPVALAVFVGGLVLALLPACFEIARSAAWVGALFTAAWTAAAILAWWGVCAPDGAPGRSRDPMAMATLFLFGVPLQLAAGTIAVAQRMLYAGIAPADQRTGGLVLWVPGGLLLWVAITAVWIRWARRSGREAGGDDAPPLTVPRGD